MLSFVIFPTINIRVKMDGLNLAKELRVFNKSYPTKAPPAEGEAAVRKVDNVVSFMCYQKLPTVATNSTHQVLLPNHGFWAILTNKK